MRHVVISGWGRKAQWFRNIEADPRVRVEIGQGRSPKHAEPGRARQGAGTPKYVARVERIEGDEAVALYRKYLGANPGVERLIPKFTGHPFDGSDEAYRELIELSPVLRLWEM